MSDAESGTVNVVAVTVRLVVVSPSRVYEEEAQDRADIAMREMCQKHLPVKNGKGDTLSFLDTIVVD